jgi:hypothetical protein
MHGAVPGRRREDVPGREGGDQRLFPQALRGESDIDRGEGKKAREWEGDEIKEEIKKGKRGLGERERARRKGEGYEKGKGLE